MSNEENTTADPRGVEIGVEKIGVTPKDVFGHPYIVEVHPRGKIEKTIEHIDAGGAEIHAHLDEIYG